MKTACCNLLALLTLSVVPVHAEECKPVHADLVEVFSTEGCNPGLTSCYLGVVDGNHGLRAPRISAGTAQGRLPQVRLMPCPMPDHSNTAPPVATC